MENGMIIDALRQRQAKLVISDEIVAKDLHMSLHSFILRLNEPNMNTLNFVNQYAKVLNCTVEFYVVVKRKKKQGIISFIKGLLSPKGGQRVTELERINSL